jgi:hypothetical protein
MHTVVAADAEGRPIRVTCGFCRSEHNYRGGARDGQEPREPREPANPRVSRFPWSPIEKGPARPSWCQIQRKIWSVSFVV